MPSTSAPLPTPNVSTVKSRGAWLGQINGVLFVALLALAVTQLSALPEIAHLRLSSLIIGIVVGALYGNTLRSGMPDSWATGVNFSARRLLRIAIAFYGLRVSFQEIVQVGLPGLTVSTAVVISTLLVGVWFCMRVLKLDRDTAILTAAGSAICGAAAVLAFESMLQSKPHKSMMAVGSVVLFGTLSMFLYPALYRTGWLPLDTVGVGLFFGGTIHEVAQVVGAASVVSADATHIATIVKMTRVVLLAPVLLVLSAWLARSTHRADSKVPRKMPVPWFALGFLFFVALNSIHILPPAVTQSINQLDTFALTMAMTALGLETRFAQIKQAGLRALLAGGALYAWLFIGGFGITVAVQRWLG